LEPSRQTATHQLDRALLVRLSLSIPHEKRTPARVSPDRRRRTAGGKPLTGNRKKPPKSPSSPDSTPAAVQEQPGRPGLKTGTPWRKIPGDVLAPSPIASANTTTKEGSEIKAGLPVEWKPISHAFCPRAAQAGSHATKMECCRSLDPIRTRNTPRNRTASRPTALHSVALRGTCGLSAGRGVLECPAFSFIGA
jgi:hypothetical protein